MAMQLKLAVPLLVLLATWCHYAAAFASVHDVPFTEEDTEGGGRKFVTSITGKRWFLQHSVDYNQIYFVEEGTDRAIWDDPRSMPLTDKEKEQLPKEILEVYERKPFEVEAARMRQQGNVTQDQLPVITKSTSSSSSTSTVTIVAVFPLIAFAGLVAGRIWYLHTYFPELLFPTKERKQRFRNNNKMKATKARGRLNQDGKGGRSANS